MIQYGMYGRNFLGSNQIGDGLGYRIYFNTSFTYTNYVLLISEIPGTINQKTGGRLSSNIRDVYIQSSDNKASSYYRSNGFVSFNTTSGDIASIAEGSCIIPYLAIGE